MWLICLKYWKFILGPIALFLILFGVYEKGRSDANAKWDKAMQIELAKRLDDYRKTVEKDNQIDVEIQNHRTNHPSDDYDTCILSHDPMEYKCH